jgi:hypothetical protein
MTDSLERIFKDRLFETKKNPDRDWSKIMERAGGELYGEVTSMFPYPEIALCALIQCLSEVALCQHDKYKRARLLDKIKDAVKDRIEEMERIEAEEAKTGYGQYEEDEAAPRRRVSASKPASPSPSTSKPKTPPPSKPIEDGRPYPEEEIDPEDEVDYEADDNQPDPPGPEPDEEEDGDSDPDQSPWVHPNPSKEAGFKPPPRRT